MATKKLAKPAGKPAKAASTPKAPKVAKAPRKAAAPLAAGLVVAKDAPALTLTAPPAPAPKRRKDAVEGPTESMGFRVPAAWAKEFRRYSFERGAKINATLMDAFEALKEKESL